MTNEQASNSENAEKKALEIVDAWLTGFSFREEGVLIAAIAAALDEAREDALREEHDGTARMRAAYGLAARPPAAARQREEEEERVRLHRDRNGERWRQCVNSSEEPCKVRDHREAVLIDEKEK